MNITFASANLPNKKEHKKNNYLQNAIGLATPFIFETAIGMPIEVAIQDKFVKHANVPEIEKYLSKAFKESNLKQAGVKIMAYKVNDNVNYLQKLYSMVDIEAGARFGRNAGYNPVLNTLILPYQKLQGAIFHEMGHAMNKNFSPVLKSLQYLRMITSKIAVPAIIFTGICTSIKHESKDNELSKMDKVKNFIHNNAGKLVFAASIPTLLEEFIASAKGNKLAAKVMPENLAKTVKMTNQYAGLCYLTAATIGALGVTAGIKVKDYLVNLKHKNKTH